MTRPGEEPDRIDLKDPAASEQWARKLDCSKQQLREAVAAVGDKAADVELWLKGSHSTTNADRVHEVNGPS